MTTTVARSTFALKGALKKYPSTHKLKRIFQHALLRQQIRDVGPM
jgi:hypothetical protein